MPTTNRQRFFPVAAVLLLIFFGAGCEDLLPVYTAPEGFFAIERSIGTLDTTKFYEPIDGSDALIASYDPFYLTFKVTNVYEETFQQKIDISGTLEIWLTNARKINSIVTMSNDNIVPTSAFNTATDVLTLDAGSSIYIRVMIDPKLSDNYYLHKYVPVASSTMVPFYVTKYYDPFTMESRCSFQLAPNIPPLTSENSFQIFLKGIFPFRP